VNSTLKNHPIWHDLAQTLKQLDPEQIALQHLQACNAQINGYWDEDEFYEVLRFTQLPYPELISSSWGLSPSGRGDAQWIQLKFALSIPLSSSFLSSEEVKQSLGEMILILDDDLEVIDENWLIDVHSPFVEASKKSI
jgi:hypothetical protein